MADAYVDGKVLPANMAFFADVAGTLRPECMGIGNSGYRNLDVAVFSGGADYRLVLLAARAPHQIYGQVSPIVRAAVVEGDVRPENLAAMLEGVTQEYVQSPDEAVGYLQRHSAQTKG